MERRATCSTYLLPVMTSMSGTDLDIRALFVSLKGAFALSNVRSDLVFVQTT